MTDDEDDDLLGVWKTREAAISGAIATAHAEALDEDEPQTIHACAGKGCEAGAVKTCKFCETITVYPSGRVEREMPGRC